MPYLQTIGGQITLFLRSFGFGFLLGALYDALRLFRLSAGRKKRLFFWDVLFGATAAFCTFLYDLTACDGQLRLFVLAAQCAGFAVWHVFVSPTVRKYGACAMRVVRRFSAGIAAAGARVTRAWARKAQKQTEKIKKIRKKFQKSKKTT